jgi:hypothetical protein
MKMDASNSFGELSHRIDALGSSLVIAAVLILLGFVAPVARASCGYYVVSAKPSTELILSHQMKEFRPQDTPCPCRGSTCQADHSEKAVPAISRGARANELAPLIAGMTYKLSTAGYLPVVNVLCVSESHLLLTDPPPRNSFLFI